MRRFWIFTLVLLASPGLAVPPATLEPQLGTGVQQVESGDLEGAVSTLQAVVERLRARSDRSPELVRAYIYLGIAHVGLNDVDAARARFRDALALDPRRRLNDSDFPPKVVAVFEEARRDAPTSMVPKGSGSSATPLFLIGAGGAAVGAGVLVAGGGGGGNAGEDGRVRFSDARFSTPSIVCNNGTDDVELPVAILVNATSSRTDTVLIPSVSATLTIVASPSSPDEVGAISERPATVSPSALGPNSTVTLRVDTTMRCGNNFGNPSRYNDWSGEVRLISTAGTATVRTSDRLRVDNP
jgi:hypothetical protein